MVTAVEAATSTDSIGADQLGTCAAQGHNWSFFDPLVEELHAELTKSEEDGNTIWSVKRVSSSRPMWVDGSLQDETTLSVGSQIVVGPYTLTLETEKEEYQLRITETRDLSALSVQSLKRRIGEVDLLSDISFTIFSGEVIALIGPSGVYFAK